MDSQAKYGSIARGAGDLYLRLPGEEGVSGEDLGSCGWGSDCEGGGGGR